MSPFDVGLVLALLAGTGGLAVHHQVRQARQARIRTEANAFDGRFDDSE